MLGSIISKFDAEAKNHMEKQSLNPFSGSFSRSPSPRLSKDQYGKPLAGSKTEERGQRAKCHILREIQDLCNCIYDVGVYNKTHKHNHDSDDEEVDDDEIIVTFGEIFQIYTKINDKVVGLLIAAKKRGFIYFEKEILFQRRDDDVLIALIKPIREIRAVINKELASNSSPTPLVSREVSPAVEDSDSSTDQSSSKTSKSSSKSKKKSPAKEPEHTETKVESKEIKEEQNINSINQNDHMKTNIEEPKIEPTDLNKAECEPVCVVNGTSKPENIEPLSNERLLNDISVDTQDNFIAGNEINSTPSVENNGKERLIPTLEITSEPDNSLSDVIIESENVVEQPPEGNIIANSVATEEPISQESVTEQDVKQHVTSEPPIEEPVATERPNDQQELKSEENCEIKTNQSDTHSNDECKPETQKTTEVANTIESNQSEILNESLENTDILNSNITTLITEDIKNMEIDVKTHDNEQQVSAPSNSDVVTENPAPVNKNSVPVTENPVAVTENLVADTENPVAVTENPNAVSENSVAGNPDDVTDMAVTTEITNLKPVEIETQPQQIESTESNLVLSPEDLELSSLPEQELNSEIQKEIYLNNLHHQQNRSPTPDPCDEEVQQILQSQTMSQTTTHTHTTESSYQDITYEESETIST